ncbi:Sphingosine kinase A [Smittium culicis]|uniref:Sphingosine kinase A n=1 Tax=Smittium culicis TaxID=133412 RepID=A0A1R1Y3J8_9FUNG|nr:Sphingosine kinase A [Smittium culicis]
MGNFDYVSLYTGGEWLEGILKVSKNGMTWVDCAENSPNTIELSNKNIFAAIFTPDKKKVYKNIKEAADSIDKTSSSTNFTVFTVCKPLDFDSKGLSSNKKRPYCDSWLFKASSEDKAHQYLHKIRDLIRPNYCSITPNALILLNPNSGKKKSNETFKKVIEPVFRLCNVKYTLIGTGNGLSWAIGCGWPELAAVSISKFITKPLDIMSVSKSDSNPTYCFLSVTWGYIADTDIESEKIRGLGSLRLDVYGIIRLIRFRKYGGKIHFLPVDTQHDTEVSNTDSGNKYDDSAISIGDNLVETKKKRSSPKKSAIVSTRPLINKNSKSIVSIKHNPSPLSFSQITPASFHENDSSKRESSSLKNKVVYSINSEKGPQMSLIDSLITKSINVPVDTSKLPPNWVTLSGPFTSVNAINSPWLSKSFMASDKASINDGLIDLIYTQEVSKLDILPYIIDSSKGGHLNKNGLFHYKTKAIIIEPDGTRYISSNKSAASDSKIHDVANKPSELPRDSKGVFSLDGERSDIGPIKIEVIPNLLNVIISPLTLDSYTEKPKSNPSEAKLKPNMMTSVVSRSASFVSFF